VKKFLLSIIILLSCFSVRAQYDLTIRIKDTADNRFVHRVNATIAGAGKTIASDSAGKIIFHDLNAGNIKISFSHVGYKNQTINVKIPMQDSGLLIYLHRDVEKTEEEVIVTSSRTDSRIEDLPTKVEVIGSEEMDEEAGTIPGQVTYLLGDVAGIQNHQSSSTSGNVDMRVQGLPGKYTQLLRDGLPLFGDYSGSFNIMQIPPLDLKQAEIIKGSTSTLYGGGAIAGMINLISKTPVLNKPQHSILLNHSTLHETNLNSFFSKRGNKAGYTFFCGTTLQKAADVNKDGFSDVPDLNSFFFHPRIFFYPNKSQTISAGYNLTYEDRKGGDMQVLHDTKDYNHQFFIQNRSLRNSIDAVWENKLNATDRLTVKGVASFFRRDINTNVFGMKASQRSFYAELSYYKKLNRHNLVAGLNISGEQFNKKQPDSTLIVPYRYTTSGFFLQDDWKISSRFITQAGFRLDHNTVYGNFALPRVSLLYKINNNFTTRLGGGLGYKIPSPFDSDIDERDYPKIIPFSTNSIRAERSSGMNWDVNYKKVFDDWRITVNQMFFITSINKPVVQDSLPGGNIYFYNAGRSIDTKGSETYVQVRYDELEIYLGYTYTVAKQLYNTTQPYLPLSANSKFAAVISNEFSSRFRACVEASFIGKQYLDNGSRTPGYFYSSAMVRYDIKNISFVLNCEDIFDYRQTQKESIVLPPSINPSFKQVWGPLEGRVFNLSANIRW
jgi:iron complex outermembrane receptor protein/outer membrane receptor for ferrienterochelin and colicins